jgi:hypothetical protein
MHNYDEAQLIEMERKAVELVIQSDRVLYRYDEGDLQDRIVEMVEQHQELIEYVRRVPREGNGR